SDRGDRRVHAYHGLHAAHERGGRHAGRWRQPRRRFQHGRCRGCKLCLHHGAAEVSALQHPEGGVARYSKRVMNLAHFMRQSACRYRDAIALAWDEKTWTWAEVDRRVDAIAAALVGRGVAKGDRILVQSK